MDEVKHISHEHPLVLLIQNESAKGSRCSVCEEGVDGATPTYACHGGGNGGKGCKFYLHKKCAELTLTPEINHPLHSHHPLVLLPTPPYSGSKYYTCNYCRGSYSGLVYHCASCLFDLHINCALLQHFDKLQHPAHDHPLTFIPDQHNKEDRRHCCSRCRNKLSGSFYRCLDCNRFQLHKECADLPLEINHPFHPSHPLILRRITSTSPFGYSCNLCGSPCFQFVYRCEVCNFQLDPDCVQLSISGNIHKLEVSPHQHPLFLIDKCSKTVKNDCLGCGKKVLKPPVYRCLDCKDVYLHKQCAELPLQIHHPLDRKHPLTLLQTPPIHSDICCCYLCKIQWKGFVYYCNVCNYGLTLEDVSSLPVIKASNHEHPWTLISRPMSFICDFCGTDGDRTPYLCSTCNLIVHRDCIPLPRKIRIMRHDHPIVHTYFLPSNRLENSECRICHKKVNTGYGSYHCSASNCNYIAHVNCATDTSIWDGTIVTGDDEVERSKGESLTLITYVSKTICVGEDIIATEIKHAFHSHSLLLMNFDGEEVKDDDNVCDGCMRPLGTDPFYGCNQNCGFFLHKSCAELPREKRHPSHKHLLTLAAQDGSPWCHGCHRFHDGFSYKCNTCYFRIDLQCSSLSDTLKHPSHEHQLFLDHNCQGYCNGCRRKIRLYSSQPSLGYKCMQGCEFILDFSCLTQPQIACYKYDRHPLALTYHDGSDPNQYYCDMCEEERDPHQWFYSCAECDNTVHPKCVLGDLPFIKLGKKLNHPSHPHPLTFVKKIWNCPPCNVCNKLCYGQAIECTKSQCNFIIHWKCGWKK